LILFLGSIASLAAFTGSAVAAEYETFVGCDYHATSPVPSEKCQIGDTPGAFIESEKEVEYEVCVEFPNLEVLCSSPLAAEAKTLYVNSITTDIPGKHYVAWYLAGTETEIGFWEFTMEEPPPPPPPPPPVTPPPLAAFGATSSPPHTPSAGCLNARRRVRKLKARLRLANCSCQEAKIRPKLKKAQAAVKRLC
jgi:hypothetical protein